jgi:glutathione S-transferase
MATSRPKQIIHKLTSFSQKLGNMAAPKEVKLFGAAISGYCTMVHHALRLKGVAYDYVEIDLKNKSEEFLEVNPVTKKVPTLVVDGKPIPESLVILQYVDETWKEPPLMPQDAYLRSKVRFWADFFYQKVLQ